MTWLTWLGIVLIVLGIAGEIACCFRQIRTSESGIWLFVASIVVAAFGIVIVGLS